MFQYAIPEMTEVLHSFLCLVYETNRPPHQWQQTYLVPIPKVPRPSTIPNFRLLTMCCWGYNLYTKFLINHQLSINVRPYYQAGFEKGRSTTDQLFILLRVMEENWRKGRKLYIMDLKRAFPSINIHKLPEILQSKGAPAYLINRYISKITKLKLVYCP
jgi:hypothetical protein